MAPKRGRADKLLLASSYRLAMGIISGKVRAQISPLPSPTTTALNRKRRRVKPRFPLPSFKLIIPKLPASHAASTRRGHLLLSQRSGACFRKWKIRPPNQRPQRNLTLHSSYPYSVEGAGYYKNSTIISEDNNGDTTERSFDWSADLRKRKNRDLRHDMRRFWPSLDRRKCKWHLWNQEWLKHGKSYFSCPLAYFQFTIDSFNKIRRQLWRGEMALVGALQMRAQEIGDHFQEAVGFRPRVEGYKTHFYRLAFDFDENGNLKDIDKQEEYMHCEATTILQL